MAAEFFLQEEKNRNKEKTNIVLGLGNSRMEVIRFIMFTYRI